jgi:hypothetical protein
VEDGAGRYGLVDARLKNKGGVGWASNLAQTIPIAFAAQYIMQLARGLPKY